MYGDVSREDVLSGNVPWPTEFLPVLDILKRNTEEATKAAMSKPGMVRSRSAVKDPSYHVGGERSGRAILSGSSNTSLDPGV